MLFLDKPISRFNMFNFCWVFWATILWFSENIENLASQRTSATSEDATRAGRSICERWLRNPFQAACSASLPSGSQWTLASRFGLLKVKNQIGHQVNQVLLLVSWLPRWFQKDIYYGIYWHIYFSQKNSACKVCSRTCVLHLLLLSSLIDVLEDADDRLATRTCWQGVAKALETFRNMQISSNFYVHPLQLSMRSTLDVFVCVCFSRHIFKSKLKLPQACA